MLLRMSYPLMTAVPPVGVYRPGNSRGEDIEARVNARVHMEAIATVQATTGQDTHPSYAIIAVYTTCIHVQNQKLNVSSAPFIPYNNYILLY